MENSMTSPLRGEALAYAVLDFIREHPEEWNQDYYFHSCGTTACFAGRVLLLAQGDKWWSRSFRMDKSIGSVARTLLGWTFNQADHVFHNYTRDFTVLEESVKEVLNGEIA